MSISNQAVEGKVVEGEAWEAVEGEAWKALEDQSSRCGSFGR